MQKLLTRLFLSNAASRLPTVPPTPASAAKLEAARRAERQAYQRAQCQCVYPGVLCRWCETTLVPLVPTAASVAAERLRADQARSSAAS